MPDAPCQEPDVPATGSGGADPLCRGVADRQVGQLALVLQALPPPVGVHGQHVDHALRGRSLPADPGPGAERPAADDGQATDDGREQCDEGAGSHAGTVRGLPRR